MNCIKHFHTLIIFSFERPCLSPIKWAYSSGGLERTPDKREVDGSSPFRPTIINRGFSSAGRAPVLHAGGQEFDPPKLHQ